MIHSVVREVVGLERAVDGPYLWEHVWQVRAPDAIRAEKMYGREAVA